jgi:hypothetical protein
MSRPQAQSRQHGAGDRNRRLSAGVHEVVKLLTGALLCVLLVGCSTHVWTSAPAASATGTAPATASAAVVIECLDATYPPPLRSPAPGASSGAFCDRAYVAVVTALAGQGGAPTMVVFDRGVYCPTPGLLFAQTTCPGGAIPPSPGGQTAGHALVSFAGTAKQAYLNLWWYGPTLTADLIAIATPPASPTPTAS